MSREKSYTGVGKRIILALDSLGLKHKGLAAGMGLAENTVSNILTIEGRLQQIHLIVMRLVFGICAVMAFLLASWLVSSVRTLHELELEGYSRNTIQAAACRAADSR